MAVNDDSVEGAVAPPPAAAPRGPGRSGDHVVVEVVDGEDGAVLPPPPPAASPRGRAGGSGDHVVVVEVVDGEDGAVTPPPPPPAASPRGRAGRSGDHVVVEIVDGEDGAVAPPPPAASPRGPAGGSGAGEAVVVLQESKMKWVYLMKAFSILASVYCFSAVGSVCAAVFLPASAMRKTSSIWLMYFTGVVAPWIAGMIAEWCSNACAKKFVPYICFVANNLACVIFSTAHLDHVALRGTVLMAILIASLVPYCFYCSWRNFDELDFWRIGMFALSVLVVIYYLDEILSPVLIGQMVTGKTVAKVSYVKVLVNGGFLIYDATRTQLVLGGDDDSLINVAGRLYVHASTDAARHVTSLGLSLFFVG